MDFYHFLEAVKNEKNTFIATVVQGKHIGEKAILSEDRVLWTNRENGVIGKNVKQLYREEKQREDGTAMLPPGAQRKVFQLDEAEIFLEELLPECKLVICGGGHIAKSLVRIGVMLDFHIIVIDDRPLFAYEASECGAHEIICKPFAEALQEVAGDENTFFVVATRGHRFDIDCMEVLMKKQAAYIGLMSSRSRAKRVKEVLLEKGADEAFVEFLHSPIGLSIGSETPDEIAVSIMAEIIQVRHEIRKMSGYSKEILSDLLNKDNQKEARVLATIIGRKGSAPRQVGTKMIIYKDGRCTGTIGGGCLEAEVISRGRAILRNFHAPALLELDMTGREDLPEGMACGGIEEVFMELLEATEE